MAPGSDVGAEIDLFLVSDESVLDVVQKWPVEL